MIIRGTEDLRVQKTMAAIEQAFSELLLENDEFERISVTALCARAKINKKTFYHYYRTLDELLQEMLEKMSQEYIQRISQYTVPDQLDAINREFFLYSMEKGRIYEKLVCNVSYHALSTKLFSEFVKRAWRRSNWFQRLTPEHQNILLCFLRSAGVELYKQWIADQKKISLDEIIALSGELLCHGVNGFVQKVSFPSVRTAEAL